jgi:hypothetical protein
MFVSLGENIACVLHRSWYIDQFLLVQLRFAAKLGVDSDVEVEVEGRNTKRDKLLTPRDEEH